MITRQRKVIESLEQQLAEERERASEERQQAAEERERAAEERRRLLALIEKLEARQNGGNGQPQR